MHMKTQASNIALNMYHIMAGKYNMLGCSVQMKENAKVRLLQVYDFYIVKKKSSRNIGYVNMINYFSIRR